MNGHQQSVVKAVAQRAYAAGLQLTPAEYALTGYKPRYPTDGAPNHYGKVFHNYAIDRR